MEFDKKYLENKTIQVIPGNLQKYVSTNRSLLQCKTLPAHFTDNVMVYYHSLSGPKVCLARLQMELCRAANIFAAR